MDSAIDAIYRRAIMDGMFSTDSDFNAVLDVIHAWDDERVRTLLRCLLMGSGELGIDEIRMQFPPKETSDSKGVALRGSEYWRRLFDYQEIIDEIVDEYIDRSLDNPEQIRDALQRFSPPWEGNTWILELLPGAPGAALQALEAYMLAHVYVLPDGRLRALIDAASLIRMKYIGLPEHVNDRIDVLNDRPWRDLEVIVARLYQQMGYNVHLTTPQKDGGKDIVAVRDALGEQDLVQIECKRWDHPVGVKEVRALLGTVSNENSPRGVFVTTSRFTREASALAAGNPRLELIDGKNLILLLNEYLGHDWPIRVEWLCAQETTEPGRAGV